MIYYFSACGNSQWVAWELAKASNDKAVSITTLKEQIHPLEPVRAGENLGLVFPVYAWAAPKPMSEFITRLSVDPAAYVYAVCTCGDDAGLTMQELSKTLPLQAAFSLTMPNTYLPLADVDSAEVVAEKLAAARAKLPEIAAAITGRQQVWDVHRGYFATIKSKLINPLFQLSRNDKVFLAEKHCTGCGICAKVCPQNNIVIEDERPVWQGNCLSCMACIHHCPERAIQWGKITKKRGRYVFPGKA